MSSIATEAANSSAEAKPTPIRSPRERIVAVVGLGYVGLPTALALFKRGEGVLGFDVDETRLARIQNEDVDLANHDRANLRLALQDRRFLLTSREEDLEFADAVIVAVPTPVDANLVPDLTFIRSACATVVRHARPGQVIVLTSTSYVGSTADLLSRPLEERGWKLGRDVFVAFSPERINPGEQAVPQGDVPRVVGGVTEECGRRAAEVLAGTAAFLHHVSSPEAAELTKLHENTFRAVNIALANEVADISRAFGLDVMEVIAAAATKPYGFVPFYPGPGVGGHCIPCDPHYLLWQLRSGHTSAPLVSRAMESIAARPFVVSARCAEVLASAGRPVAGSKVLVVGVAYKPGVADFRESPALRIISDLQRQGAQISYFDPLVPSIRLQGGGSLRSLAETDLRPCDMVLLHTLHPGMDWRPFARLGPVLDTTFHAGRNEGVSRL